MSAATKDGFAAQHRNVLIISAVGHILLLLALGSNLLKVPHQPMTLLAIEAVLVDQNTIKRSNEADQRKTEQAAQRKRDEAARQQQQEQERQATEQRRQQQAKADAEKRRVDQQRKDSAAQAAADRQRKQADAERKLQEQQKAEARARAEKERVAAAARARAEAEARNQARRQAELMASMEAEEGLLAARESGELSRYLALIQQKVERNWVPPASVQEGLECEVAVQQLPNGDVVDARTISCNGDAAVQRSVENAVRRSSPLPLPDNRALFERNLRFIFKPQQ
ncbi:MAG: cell envelope integrity protein TolA [Gammaproteobacteria bacterium]|nr:MAG: cell envelope integrity protein TolA [Gammaproteobacteria bacterium]